MTPRTAGLNKLISMRFRKVADADDDVDVYLAVIPVQRRRIKTTNFLV